MGPGLLRAGLCVTCEILSSCAECFWHSWQYFFWKHDWIHSVVLCSDGNWFYLQSPSPVNTKCDSAVNWQVSAFPAVKKRSSHLSACKTKNASVPASSLFLWLRVSSFQLLCLRGIEAFHAWVLILRRSILRILCSVWVVPLRSAMCTNPWRILPLSFIIIIFWINDHSPSPVFGLTFSGNLYDFVLLVFIPGCSGVPRWWTGTVQRDCTVVPID